MIYQGLRALLISGLLSISSAKPHSTLSVKGEHNPAVVQALYDSLGGTFALDSDIFGPDAHFSELHFSNDSAAYHS